MDKVFLLFEDTKSPVPSALVFRAPIAEVKAFTQDEVKPCFQQLQEWQKKGFYVAGYVAYEAGYALIDKKIAHPPNTELPLLQFYIFKNQEKVQFADLEEFQKTSNLYPAVFDFQENITFPEYEKNIKILKEHFAAGDSYQTNFSLRQSFKTSLTPFELYKRLRAYQKVAYGAFLNLPDFHILSFSPELFLKKEGDMIITKPMKGTAPRSQDSKADEANKKFLQSDEKILAENLMIVDLLRNDLGRIAKPGSVHTANLFEVQSFESLHQMITTITANVDKDVELVKVFSALFPCGSITGAPKMRTMELIAELEKNARGIYTGAIGYITPENDFSFNVAIRTLVEKAPNTYELGLGGGVLVDSNIKSEYEECHLKGQFIKNVNSEFSLFETFLFAFKEAHHLADHFERLEKSCRFFGFSFDKLTVVNQLLQFLKDYEQPHKVKISVRNDGTVNIEAKAIHDSLLGHKVVVSQQTTNSQDIFLQHKTSHREMYDSEWKKAVAAGYYDTLFFNERKELTEASRHNVFLKIKGLWYTPPVTCGLLPGIQRAVAITELNATEKILTLQDLQTSEQIMLTNSVRGNVEVTL